jgi:hypothetical protein
MELILSTFFSALLSAATTLYIVEKRKQAEKRAALFNVLYLDLQKYFNPESVDQLKISWTRPHRVGIITNMLQSDLLNPKKDAELIRELHELLLWIEAFNNYAENLNVAIMMKSAAAGELNELAVMSSKEVYKQRGIVIELLDRNR